MSAALPMTLAGLVVLAPCATYLFRARAPRPGSPLLCVYLGLCLFSAGLASFAPEPSEP